MLGVIAASRRKNKGVEFPFTTQSTANILIVTADGSPYQIDWGDGNIIEYASSVLYNTHNYSSPTSGIMRVITQSSAVRLQCNSGAFDFTNVSEFTSLTYLNLSSNSFTGDMSGVSLLTSLTFLLLNGNFTINYTSTTFAANFQRWHFRPATTTNPMSPTELDQMLIDASQTTWAGVKAIYADGNNGVRTSASDAAVLSLQAQGVTLYLNV